jgi:hypothetical protein
LFPAFRDSPIIQEVSSNGVVGGLYPSFFTIFSSKRDEIVECKE